MWRLHATGNETYFVKNVSQFNFMDSLTLINLGHVQFASSIPSRNFIYTTSLVHSVVFWLGMYIPYILDSLPPSPFLTFIKFNEFKFGSIAYFYSIFLYFYLRTLTNTRRTQIHCLAFLFHFMTIRKKTCFIRPSRYYIIHIFELYKLQHLRRA